MFVYCEMDDITVMTANPMKTHVTKRSMRNAGSRTIGVREPGVGVFCGADTSYLPECPAEPSCCVACTTRAAMAVSASLPHARGS